MNRFKIYSCFFVLLLTGIIISCNRYQVDYNGAGNPLVQHINDSLWAYFPVNGNTGDSSGNGRDMELFNGASVVFDFTLNSDVLDFDGADDFGKVSGDFPAGDFSLSFFVKLRDNRGRFLTLGDYQTGYGNSFDIGIDTTTTKDTIRLSLATNQAAICNEHPDGTESVLNNWPVYPGVWNYVVASYSNGVLKIWFNNNLVSTRSTSVTGLNTCSGNGFTIGSWWEGNKQAFNGRMDNIRIYNRVLTAEEIAYLYNNRQ